MTSQTAPSPFSQLFLTEIWVRCISLAFSCICFLLPHLTHRHLSASHTTPFDASLSPFLLLSAKINFSLGFGLNSTQDGCVRLLNVLDRYLSLAASVRFFPSRVAIECVSSMAFPASPLAYPNVTPWSLLSTSRSFLPTRIPSAWSTLFWQYSQRKSVYLQSRMSTIRLLMPTKTSYVW